MTREITSWQLGLRGVEAGWDVLSDLLEARGAEVDNDPDEGLLVATFAGAPDLIIIDALGAWLENLGIDGAEVRTRLAGADPWQASWRAVFHAGKVSERLWVRPVWEPPVEGRTDVIIDPTNAFGGGFHPTTSACLVLLDRALAAIVESGVAHPTVLDVGAGTGILAIAAAHLGAGAVGVEIIETACLDAEKNAALNGVSRDVRIVHDTLEPDQPVVDLVVANVVAPVLIALAQTILQATGKELILSGIQESQEDAVRAAYASVRLVERVIDRGWITLRFAR